MDDVALISPPPSFGAADHDTLAKVAQVAGSKILDCTRIAAVPLNIAQVVTAGWAAPAGSVPRLALVLEIDVWAVARMLATPSIAAARAHGTDFRLLYRTQLAAGHVHAWIKTGAEPPYELGTTLEQLDTVWNGTHMATNVVDAFEAIVLADTSEARPLHLARLGSIAQKFADPTKGMELTRQALKESMGRHDPIGREANAIAMATAARLGA